MLFEQEKYLKYIKTLQNSVYIAYILIILIFTIMSIYILKSTLGAIIGIIIGILISKMYTLKIKIRIQEMYWKIDIYNKKNKRKLKASLYTSFFILPLIIVAISIDKIIISRVESVIGFFS